ncbi:MAG: 8-oxo-dGTP diphosphatase [Gammaproteobacteria bacterium]|nr:8-oxo-dGTP diphosphatase [Gammaproteobacteria bacterium]
MNVDPHSSGLVDVAVGVIRDATGRVLVNRRRPGKSFAGQWEFPGGKIQASETVAQALSRELDEELGIHIKRQRPLISFSHRYRDGAVHLHVSEILSYRGTPTGREGQPLRWVESAGLDQIDLLDANAAIVRAIVLPRICLITDTRRFGVKRTLKILQQHVRQRDALVIVREKALARDPLLSFVGEVREICRRGASLVCVHADCNFDDYGNVDCIHFPSTTLEQDHSWTNAEWTGVSCHSGKELELAQGGGADYALLSPVMKTASHPPMAPLGWSRFVELGATVSAPVYALGGMEFTDFDTAVGHGAQGIAMLGAAWR